MKPAARRDGSTDYFDWQGGRQGATGGARADRSPARSTDSTAASSGRPPESIEVHEFDGASTTIIEKIRGALAKRMRGE